MKNLSLRYNGKHIKNIEVDDTYGHFMGDIIFNCNKTDVFNAIVVEKGKCAELYTKPRNVAYWKIRIPKHGWLVTGREFYPYTIEFNTDT